MSSTLLAQNARQILLAALPSEFGLRIKVQSTDQTITPALRARQVLYRFKAEDSDFASLQIRLDPDEPDTHLWIIPGRFIADVEHPTKTKDPNLLDIEVEI